jgi:hypothetical protein
MQKGHAAKVPGHWAFAMFLYQLAHKGTIAQTGHVFGMHEADVGRYLNDILKLIKPFFVLIDLRQTYKAEWLRQQIPQYIQAIRQHTGCCLKFFGFIDGTRYAIARPTGDTTQRVFYNGWKRIHNVLFQGVVTPDGLCQDFFGAVEGRENDKYTYNVCTHTHTHKHRHPLFFCAFVSLLTS